MMPAWTSELAGWELAWTHLEAIPGAPACAALARRRERVGGELRTRFAAFALAEDPIVRACRALFKQAGTDPTRYRPSSESLLRRVVKGEALPEIHPLVDLNNQLSIELRVPACILAEGTFDTPVHLRAGRAGETLDAMRGPLDLAGKPLLEDGRGPFGTPITDGHRVKVVAETRRAWLVAYLPEELVTESEAAAQLAEILAEAPVARVLAAGAPT